MEIPLKVRRMHRYCIWDEYFNVIFIYRTYGKLILAAELLIVSALQFEHAASDFYSQAAYLVVGMVLVKLAHLASQAGNSKAAHIDRAIQHKNRAEDWYQQKYACVLRRAAAASLFAQSTIFRSSIRAIAAAELRVRSLVKSVLCAVTETLTPKLFPCPPCASA
jgi:predicted transcriptional regulator